MQRAIQVYGKAASPTLAGFAETLRVQLESEMTRLEKDSGSLIYVAGYVTDTDGIHPQFFFVRNLVRSNNLHRRRVASFLEILANEALQAAAKEGPRPKR